MEFAQALLKTIENYDEKEIRELLAVYPVYLDVCDTILKEVNLRVFGASHEDISEYQSIAKYPNNSTVWEQCGTQSPNRVCEWIHFYEH